MLNTQDVACVIDAKHLCVNSRGIGDIGCSTITSEFGGIFKSPTKKQEFLKLNEEILKIDLINKGIMKAETWEQIDRVVLKLQEATA